MLTHNDLKKGIEFILDGQPYEILESSSFFKGRGSSVVPTKIKNLITGAIISKTFHPGEKFEEAEIEKISVKFLYTHRGKYFFKSEKSDESKDSSLPTERSKGKDEDAALVAFAGARVFDLPKDIIGDSAIFLKQNQIVDGLRFKEQIINISLPIKVQLKVTEAPPGAKGDRAQSGTKVVTLESGAQINAPLFVEVGDIIEVNTETGEYGRRVE